MSDHSSSSLIPPMWIFYDLLPSCSLPAPSDRGGVGGLLMGKVNPSWTLSWPCSLRVSEIRRRRLYLEILSPRAGAPNLTNVAPIPTACDRYKHILLVFQYSNMYIFSWTSKEVSKHYTVFTRIILHGTSFPVELKGGKHCQAKKYVHISEMVHSASIWKISKN